MDIFLHHIHYSDQSSHCNVKHIVTDVLGCFAVYGQVSESCVSVRGHGSTAELPKTYFKKHTEMVITKNTGEFLSGWQ